MKSTDPYGRTDYFLRPFLRRIFYFNEQVVGVDTQELTPMAPDEANWLEQALCEEGGELATAHLNYDAGYPDEPGTTVRPFEDPRDVVVGQVDACVM